MKKGDALKRAPRDKAPFNDVKLYEKVVLQENPTEIDAEPGLDSSPKLTVVTPFEIAHDRAKAADKLIETES